MRLTLLRLPIAFALSLTLTACAASAVQPTRTAVIQNTESPTESPTSRPPSPTKSGQTLPVAPECNAPAHLTPPMTEGPFFTPNSPERTSLLEPGIRGTTLKLTGYVLTRDCQPVARALVDFWQADTEGQYDNSGYRLRGHQFTDEAGRYQLETIMPGLYPGRTEHIHVKVQAPNGPVLTTQLFFPGVAENQNDSIFDPSLVVNLKDAPEGKVASYNFVIE
jgi:protocatechuate 3,4-dioxygenase beta subunit